MADAVNNEIISTAKANNLRIMPLLVNAHFDQGIIHNFLASTTAQDALVNFLIEESLKNGFIGWQLDIEHISYLDRDAYSMFIEKIAKAFKEKNLQISVAAVARINDDETDFYKNWSGAFDYERLARAADFISIMTYDDPDSTGPSASLPYIKNVYSYLKGKVPPQKLSLGIPLYNWGWTGSPPEKTRAGSSYQKLQKIRATHMTYEGFNSNYMTPFLIYFTKSKRRPRGYTIWFEDERSLGAKLDFMKTNDLRGFSAWVLGLESPAIWTVLKKSY